MKRIFYISTLLLLLVACGKDRFQTKPQLKLISVSSNEVPVNGSLKVVFEFTDKEGDVSDSIFITKQRINERTVSRTLRDSLDFLIPQFPKAQQGLFELNLTYQNELISAEDPPRIPGSSPSRFEPDTLRIKFLVKDKGGNKSDSIILDPIAVLR